MRGDGAWRITEQICDFVSYIKLEYYIILLPFIILLFITIFKKNRHKVIKVPFVFNIILLFFIIGMHHLSLLTLNDNVFQVKNQIVTNKSLYEKPVIQELALKQLGSVRFLIRDIIYMINPNSGESEDFVVEISEKKQVSEEKNFQRFIDDSEWLELINNEQNEKINTLNKFFISKPITDKNIMTGRFKDKNLILIMIEAFDMMAINKELTPTLYKLANEGWYFDNCIPNVWSSDSGFNLLH